MSLSYFFKFNKKGAKACPEQKPSETPKVFPLFTTQITVPYYDVGFDFELTPAAVLHYAENAAAGHCAAIGKPIPLLLEEGFIWMLARGQMEMKRYPRYGETITIETWLSERSAVHAWREYHIIDSTGTLIGYCRGDWVFIDIKKRRPCRIIDAFIQGWPLNQVKALDRPMSKQLQEHEEFEFKMEFMVRRGDIDTNRHVNNVRYLEWATEAIPQQWYESKKLTYIEGNFVQETGYGHTVVSAVTPYDKGFIHVVSDKEAGIALANAISEWNDR